MDKPIVHRLDNVLFPRLYSPTITPILLIFSVAGSTVLQSYFSGALTVALPSIGDQLGLSGQSLQWPLSIYSLMNGACLILFGNLADSFGRRLFFFIGIVWLMAMSIGLTFVGKSSALFIILSGALGLGCAIITPSATGLLSQLPEGKLRNAAYSTLGAGQPIGFIGGLMAGGALAESNWHIILYLQAGCAFFFSILAIISLPADMLQKDDRKMVARLLSFDWIGAFLSTSGLILLTFALADAGSNAKGWQSPVVPAALPLSALLLFSFALWERKVELKHTNGTTNIAPLLPHSIWSVPMLKPLLSMIFFAWACFNVFSYFATLYIQEVQGLSPNKASLQFITMVLSGIAYNIIAYFTMARLHALWLITAGCIGGIVSCLVFGLLGESTSYWSGLFIAFLFTTSTDLMFPPSQLYACTIVGPRRASIAGGLFNTTTRLATSLGLALTASISSAVTKSYVKQHPEYEATSPRALLKGYQGAVWFCMALSVVSLVIALIWMRSVGIVGTKAQEVSDLPEDVVATMDGAAIALQTDLKRQTSRIDSREGNVSNKMELGQVITEDHDDDESRIDRPGCNASRSSSMATSTRCQTPLEHAAS